MEEKISKEMFDEFVRTAEVLLSDEEAAAILTQMNQQLVVIRELESIPLDEDLAPVIHGNPYPMSIRTELREDVWVPYPNAQAIVAQAPHSKDGYIVSPDVAHQKIS